MTNSKSRKPLKLVLLLTTIALAGLAVGVTMMSGGGSDSEQIVQSESSSTPVTASTDADTDTETTVTEATDTLYLNVESPADQSVTETASVVVAGSTLPTALVSANGKLLQVDGSGRFSASIDLESGPNFVEVIASTIGGTEISEILSVVYIP